MSTQFESKNWDYYIWPADTSRLPQGVDPLVHVKKELGSHGKQGWELVLSIDIGGKPHLVFKRLRRPLPPLPFKLLVHQDGDYGGFHTGAYNTSVKDIVEEQIHDKMSSFQLEQGRSVIFYYDANCANELFRCPSPQYPNYDNPGVLPQHNDQMSSFRLFADPNFTYEI